MNTRNDQDLDIEIKNLNNKKIICIVAGALIAVACIVGMIFLNIIVEKTVTEASLAYEYGEISLDEYLNTVNSTMILSLLEWVCGLGITGGTALAVAGGIVNHVKAKNRMKKQHHRNVADEYGGNGVEF